MSKHMNYREAMKAEIGMWSFFGLLFLSIGGAYLKNPIITLVPVPLSFVSLAYFGYWMRQAMKIDEVYYGQSCEECRKAIADCTCMAEIDGAWDDAFEEQS